MSGLGQSGFKLVHEPRRPRPIRHDVGSPQGGARVPQGRRLEVGDWAIGIRPWPFDGDWPVAEGASIEPSVAPHHEAIHHSYRSPSRPWREAPIDRSTGAMAEIPYFPAAPPDDLE
jgi:hypothetical protein